MNPIRLLLDRGRLLGQSFQTKLMLMLALPLLAIWGIVALTSASMLELQQAFVGNQQATMVKRLADDLNEKIRDRFAMLQAVADKIDVARLSAPHQAGAFLAQRHALRPVFPLGILIYDRAGTVLGDFPVAGREGRNFADRENLQRLYATGKPNVSERFMSRALQRMVINLCVPILGADQQTTGALCGVVDLQASNLLGRLSDPASMGDNGSYLISASNRVLIASTDHSRLMEHLPDNPLSRQLMMADDKTFVEKK